MERIPTLGFYMLLLVFCGFSQVYAAELVDHIHVDAITMLVNSLGGELGVRAIGASGTIVQILIRVLQSKGSDRFFYRQKPWVRLALVSVLTFAVTPLSLMAIPGIPLSAALMHSATLNAFMVFLDQILKHSPGKKDEVRK